MGQQYYGNGYIEAIGPTLTGAAAYGVYRFTSYKDRKLNEELNFDAIEKGYKEEALVAYRQAHPDNPEPEYWELSTFLKSDFQNDGFRELHEQYQEALYADQIWDYLQFGSSAVVAIAAIVIILIAGNPYRVKEPKR